MTTYTATRTRKGHECQSCEARWYGRVSQGTLADHENRWHDGAQTVFPVTAEVIEEIQPDHLTT